MNKRPFYTIIIILLLSASVSAANNNQPKCNATEIYLDDSFPIEKRIEDALSRMTLHEKVDMCHAQSKFSSPGVPRLGIPEVWSSDGPHGIREEVLWDEWKGAKWTNDSCTAYPALTCLAATWNPDIAALYGKSIGQEARYRNKNVLLGPGVNIYRTPLNGRNFEYMGEDPFLASTMVVPYIREVQKNGVAACVKHFALNNQEDNRYEVNVEVSDRALREIYLPAFEAAVKEGKAWAVMGSYNKYKQEHCCHNNILLNKILKQEWAFDGVVISDWGGTHNMKEAAMNGLDMEFGTWTNDRKEAESNSYSKYYLADPFLKAIQSGEIDEKIVDEKVRRILRLIFRTTMDRTRPWGSFSGIQHTTAARQIAEEGIVLLKNNKKTLPLDPDKINKLLIVGENATRQMTKGGGSSSLKVRHEYSPLEGIINRFGKEKVTYIKGYSSKDEKAESLETLSAAAKEADAVIFFGGLNKEKKQDSEGADRTSYSLPYGQDEIIATLAKANPKTVVTIISGNAVAMPWADQVNAIVEGWYCGSEAGNAIAAVLAGDVNPSGKLPFTYPVNLNDNGAIATGGYPGVNGEEKYSEDIYVGYRWTDKKNIKPLFSFGHGLSYTNFEYGKTALNGKTMGTDGTITLTASVKNTGSRDGAETVQLYLEQINPQIDRAVKELKGFQKVFLKAGETKAISFTITGDALRYWDEKESSWKVSPGNYEALVAASSTDIRSKVLFTIK